MASGFVEEMQTIWSALHGSREEHPAKGHLPILPD